MRLSFDWILPPKPAAYKVALVAVRHRYESGRYRAQGISTTILTKRVIGSSEDIDHWVSDIEK
jgi:hypothetical protein